MRGLSVSAYARSGVLFMLDGGGVKNFMEELGLTFPALLDLKMEVLHLYRLSAIPASFLIDKQGIVRFRELGYRDWTDPESTKPLQQVLR